MKQIKCLTFNKIKSDQIIRLILFLPAVVIISLNAGCANFHKPWRSYKPQPFNAERWKNGDTIERGTMVRDLVGSYQIKKNGGKDQSEVLKNLGQPDEISEKNTGSQNSIVWIYLISRERPDYSGLLSVYFVELRVYFDTEGNTRFADLSKSIEA